MAQCNRRPQRPTPPPPPPPQPQPQPSPPPDGCQVPMNRWPHPIPQSQPTPPRPRMDNDAQYVRCTLAYQNQLLSDIKNLLQTLVQQGKEASS